MNPLTISLLLLVAQGLLGGFDTLYHHELRAALPQQASAAPELRIHAVRSVLYGVLFGGLAPNTGSWPGQIGACTTTSGRRRSRPEPVRSQRVRRHAEQSVDPRTESPVTSGLTAQVDITIRVYLSVRVPDLPPIVP